MRLITLTPLINKRSSLLFPTNRPSTNEGYVASMPASFRLFPNTFQYALKRSMRVVVYICQKRDSNKG